MVPLETRDPCRVPAGVSSFVLGFRRLGTGCLPGDVSLRTWHTRERIARPRRGLLTTSRRLRSSEDAKGAGLDDPFTEGDRCSIGTFRLHPRDRRTTNDRRTRHRLRRAGARPRTVLAVRATGQGDLGVARFFGDTLRFCPALRLSQRAAGRHRPHLASRRLDPLRLSHLARPSPSPRPLRRPPRLRPSSRCPAPPRRSPNCRP